MSRGINKEAIFKEQRERTRMLNLIRENTMEYDVEIYSYCIMPNHFHLLIKADLKELASFMAKVLAKFAKYYNQKHNRVGHVFQGRYRVFLELFTLYSPKSYAYGRGKKSYGLQV